MKLHWIKPFRTHSAKKLEEFPNRVSFMMSFDDVEDRDQLIEFLSPLVADTIIMAQHGAMVLVNFDTPQEVMVFKLQYSEFMR